MNRERKDGIGKEFTRYVIPSVTAMLASSVYIILDGVFVGQGIGEVALGAVNIVFPFIFTIVALSLLIAVGGANVYSFYKGRGQTEEANNVFNQCLALLLILSVAVSVPAFVFRRGLAVFLGANQDILPYANAFLTWASPFIVLQTIVLGIGVFLRNDNAPRLVMVSSVVASALNIVLEFVWIILMHKGIEFTVIANGIAMFVQLVICTNHFARKQGELRIRPPVFRRDDLRRVFSNGLSTFLMELSQSTVSYTFNLAMIRSVGTLGVTAYSIVTYMGSIVYSVMIGVTQGAQPIMSFRHGKGEEDVVYRVYRLGARTNIIAAAAFVALCLLFGGHMASLFHSGNGTLTALTARMLDMYPLGYLFVGVTLMNILFFQTTERDGYSTLVSFLRCVGFVQLAVLVFGRLFGSDGIYLSFCAGEFCNFALSRFLVRRSVKTLGASAGRVKE